MNKIKIILVSGKAEHGKSTFSNFLIEKLQVKNNKVIKTFFAKYIKQYASELGWDGKTKDEYWRNFLQTIGTETIQQKLNMKVFHPNRISEDIEILKNYGVEYFVIDDCRFRREIYYIKSVFPDDVITIRIENDNVKSKLNKEQLQHKSEVDLDNFDFDYIFKNNGTLDDLSKKIDEFIEYVL